MIRRPDCVPAGTVRNSSQPRYNPSTIFVLPPGSVLGTSEITFDLLKPRIDGIASSTCAPLLNVRSDTRSCASSKDVMNRRDASRTTLHLEPIELETSRTSDRSTMRRVASPLLLTLTESKLPSRMKVVGSVAVPTTVTVLIPVDASVFSEKNPGSTFGSVTDDVPR